MYQYHEDQAESQAQISRILEVLLHQIGIARLSAPEGQDPVRVLLNEHAVTVGKEPIPGIYRVPIGIHCKVLPGKGANEHQQTALR